MKKLLTLLPLATLALVGCAGLLKTGEEFTPIDNTKTVNVGILQPVEHVALKAASDGFQAAIKEAGLDNVKFNYRNAGGNDADLNMLAKNLVDDCDMSLGIGTGAAKALLAAEKNAGYKKPLLFTAVTDPVGAGLVDSADNPKGFVCGTTDANPVEAQIDLVKEFKPDAQKVGIVYTQTEENSKVQSDQAEAAIKAAGMTSLVRTCNNSSDIKTAVDALISSNVDAIYVPTDNNIAANMNIIKQATNLSHTLVVCGEENMLAAGGHITLSIDYTALGRAAGEMAAKIIKGESKPTDFKVEAVPAENCTYVYSSSNLSGAGLTMPGSMLSGHDWKDVA